MKTGLMKLCICLALLAPVLPAAAGEEEGAPPAVAFSPDAARDIIRDVRRIVTPQGIEELKAVEIGGIRQWISVRGRDRRNPILLFIHGGPASTEMPVSWLYQSPWEDFFTVVQWDQRGAGKTAAENDDPAIAGTISIERMTADGEELVAYLRKQYDKQRIFVLGHSWGSVIGLNIARRHPQWLHAYIGMGQVIHATENERVGYDFALHEAKAAGNRQAIDELEGIAPYPGPDGAVSIPQILIQRKWVTYFGGLTAGRTSFDYDTNARLLAPEYDARDLAAQQNMGESLVQLLPELARLDFRSVTRVDTPVFLFAGRRDYATPSAIAADWLARLQAPQKDLFWFERSAHMMHMEEPGQVLLRLVRDIRPIAERAGDAAPGEKADGGR